MMDGVKKIAAYIKQKPNVLVIIGLVGIVLIFVSGFFGGGNKSSSQATENITAQEYAKSLQTQLEQAVHAVTGGEASVVVTLETDIEYVYASEVKEDSKQVEDVSGTDQSKIQKDGSNEKNYVIVNDEQGNDVPLIVTSVMPRVKGVVVTCEGGDDAALQQKIETLVSTALDISSQKVCVMGMQSSK